MATLGEFLSPEAGQARRKWLDETLGQIIPPELRGWVNAGAELNPVTNMERAGTAAQRMTAPGLSGWDRMAAAGDMATNMGAVLAPVAGAKAGANSANAIVEALTAASPMKGAVDDFLVDEFGGVGFRAYHGSPHDFDRFSLDKIGTGEGAQAYGHGLYFADSEAVAKAYRDGLTPELRQLIGYAGPDNQRHAAKFLAGNVPESEILAVLSDLGDSNPQASLDAGRAILADAQKAGRMYEVQINADPNDFLDWDKPLSAQSPVIRDAFSTLGTPDRLASVQGENAYRALSSNLGALDWPVGADAATRRQFYTQGAVNATERLREAGIPGIRYLDAGSRGAGDGSRNYVVFDDKLIEILRKYGLAGAVPLGAVLGQPQDPMGSYLEAQ